MRYVVIEQPATASTIRKSTVLHHPTRAEGGTCSHTMKRDGWCDKSSNNQDRRNMYQ